MSAPKLTDPILNDLVRFITGREKPNFSHQGVTRFLLHLARLDGELAEARKASGRIALRVNEEVVQISNRRLADLTSEVERLRESLEKTTADSAALDGRVQTLTHLEAALFDEFGEAIGLVEGASAAEIALALLRLWRPAAENRGHESTDTSDAPPPDRSPAGGAAAGAGAGPGRRSTRTIPGPR